MKIILISSFILIGQLKDGLHNFFSPDNDTIIAVVKTLVTLARADIYDWFGLVSLFNGISTFLGYLMPKPFSKKNSSGTI